MYDLKQVIHVLIMPLTLVLLLASAGFLLRWLGRRRISLAAFVVAALVGYLSTTGLVAKALLRLLEQEYPPLDPKLLPRDVSFIVVLGSAYHPRDDIPITASFDTEGLARIVEGVRLFQLYPQARLVVSGGAPGGKSRPAHGYAAFARAFGVPARSLVILDRALDTAGEARDIAPLVGQEPFILVTSAHHLPRAMRLMKRSGLHAIPAAATQRTGPFVWRELLPSATGLRATELAIHEYGGLAALALRID